MKNPIVSLECSASLNFAPLDKTFIRIERKCVHILHKFLGFEVAQENKKIDKIIIEHKQKGDIENPNFHSNDCNGINKKHKMNQNT